MAKKYLSVFCFFLVLTSVYAQRKGDDYALFFVVTNYTSWPALPGIDKDLRELANELEQNYGFKKVDFNLDPTKADIQKKLTEYQSRNFGPEDQLLVFFSMHGYYDDAIGALIPRDGMLEDPAYQTWLLHPALEAMLTKIKCQHILLALDACYSGTFGQKDKNKPDPPPWDQEPVDCSAKCSRALQRKSRLYLTSGGKERTPAQSQFVRKWLEALRLKNSDGLLLFYNLYATLSEAYPKPMHGDFKDHVVGGDFVFMKKNGCIQTKSNSQVDASQIPPKNEVLKNNTNVALKPITDFGYQPDEFVYVQGGRFKMGDKCKGCNEDEKPIHDVFIGDYYIDKYEVTNIKFVKFLNSKGNRNEGGSMWIDIPDCDRYACPTIYYSKKDSMYKVHSDRAQHPVNSVTYYGARAYCKWLTEQTGKNYRLPTEAEWEYAARGGALSKGYKYSGSDKIADVCWFDGDTHAIGNLKSNELGLFDMTGNVAEWCSDWYSNKYYETIDKNEYMSNPTGPFSGDFKIARGGSNINENYSYGIEGLFRLTARRHEEPTTSEDSIGFRVVRSKN